MKYFNHSTPVQYVQLILLLLAILSFGLLAEGSEEAYSFTVDTVNDQLTVLFVEPECHFQTSGHVIQQNSLDFCSHIAEQPVSHDQLPPHDNGYTPCIGTPPPLYTELPVQSMTARDLIDTFHNNSHGPVNLNSKHIRCCKEKRKQANCREDQGIFLRFFKYFKKHLSSVIAVQLRTTNTANIYAIKREISIIYNHFTGMQQYVFPTMLLGYIEESERYKWVIIMRVRKPTLCDPAATAATNYTVPPILPHKYARLTKEKKNSTPLLGLVETNLAGQTVHQLKRLGDIRCSHQQH